MKCSSFLMMLLSLYVKRKLSKRHNMPYKESFLFIFSFVYIMVHLCDGNSDIGVHCACQGKSLLFDLLKAFAWIEGSQIHIFSPKNLDVHTTCSELPSDISTMVFVINLPKSKD